MQESNTIYHYTITKPDGSRQKIYFNYHADPQDRLSDISKLLNEENVNYCNDNWITFNSGGFGDTPEDKTKRFLESLANAILYEDKVSKHNILNKHKIKEIVDNEIHIDSFFEDYDKPEDLESCIGAINTLIEESAKGDGKIIQPEPIVDKVAERRKTRTKLDKFNDIYGAQSNEYVDYIEDNRLPYMPKYWTEVKSNTKETKGIIDKNKPHKVEWVNVRVDRRFNFDDKNFRISENVKQYLYAGHTKRWETYRDDFKMVKVLCFEQYGEYYFYDENIDEITEMVELES